jgi:hypothetical protein
LAELRAVVLLARPQNGPGRWWESNSPCWRLRTRARRNLTTRPQARPEILRALLEARAVRACAVYVAAIDEEARRTAAARALYEEVRGAGGSPLIHRPRSPLSRDGA